MHGTTVKINKQELYVILITLIILRINMTPLCVSICNYELHGGMNRYGSRCCRDGCYLNMSDI